MAVDGGFDTRQIFRLAGLDTRRLNLLEQTGASMRQPTLDALANSTGLQSSRLAAMTLQRFAGTALRTDFDRNTWVAANDWGLVNQSRYCPECLREEPGVWRAEWRLGLVSICTAHRSLLRDTCPGCEELTGSRRPSSGVRGWNVDWGHLADPSMCGMPTNVPPRFCTMMLSEQPVGPKATPAQLRAQLHVNRVLRTAHAIQIQPPVADNARTREDPEAVAVDPRDYLADVRRLIRLLIPDSHPIQPRAKFPGNGPRYPRGTTQLPPELVAEHLPRAISLVDDPAHGDSLQALLEQLVSTYSSPATVQNALRPFRTPGIKVAAAATLRTSGKPVNRLRVAYYSQFDPPASVGYLRDNVPPYLRATQVGPFSGTAGETSDLLLRLVVPAMLVRATAQEITWQDAIAHLGGRSLLTPKACSRVVGLISNHGDPARFRDAYRALASEIAKDLSISYPTQHERLMAYRAISRKRWSAIAKAARGRDSGGPLRFAASAWVWSELTSRDPRLAPSWSATTPHPTRRLLAHRFEQDNVHRYLAHLRELGRELATDLGIQPLGAIG